MSLRPEKVPVDKDGNLVREAHDAVAWISGKDSFIASLALHEYWKFGAANRLVLVNTFTGKKYPVFLKDYLDMTSKASSVCGEYRGEWVFCKKSSYYGIFLLQEL